MASFFLFCFPTVGDVDFGNDITQHMLSMQLELDTYFITCDKKAETNMARPASHVRYLEDKLSSLAFAIRSKSYTPPPPKQLDQDCLENRKRAFRISTLTVQLAQTACKILTSCAASVWQIKIFYFGGSTNMTKCNFVSSTEGALRRPMTYDDQSHPSQNKAPKWNKKPQNAFRPVPMN